MIRTATLFFICWTLFAGCKNPLGDLDPVSNTFCAGKADPTIDEECNALSETLKWDFSNSSDYTYDPNFIEISEGSAKLKTMDQTHTGSDLNDGTHVGTYFDTTNSKVLLKDKQHDSLTVNEIIPVKSNSLIAYWRMDGDTNDETSNNNDLVLNGDASFSADSQVGSHSILLDGSGDYATAENEDQFDFDASASYAISFWVKPIVLNAWQTLITTRSKLGGPCCSAGLNISVNSAGSIRLKREDSSSSIGGASTGSVVYQGGWQHIVVVVSPPKAVIYHNGVSVGNSNSISGSTENALPLRIGYDSNGSRNANALFDEVAIWRDELTAAEVSDLYKTQLFSFTELSQSWTPRYSDLVGYWKMDGNWQDSSGNGNHGTVNGNSSFAADAQVGNQNGVFDGNGDYVSIPSPMTSNQANAHSVSLWFKYTNACPSLHCVLVGQSRSANDAYLYLLIKESTHEIHNWFKSSAKLPNNWKDGSWHHLSYVHLPGGTAGSDSFYFDGVKLTTTINSGSWVENTTNWRIGCNESSTHCASGHLDDLAIWSYNLSDADIKLIYNRQKQKYAGHYESPVIDLGASGSWTNLDAVTSLPYGKEIVAQSSESSSDYSSLSGDLSDGLVGLWHLNEASVTDGANNDFWDSSGNGYHGESIGALLPGGSSPLVKSPFFDGATSQIDLDAHASNLEGHSTGTIAFWFTTPSTTTQIPFSITEGATTSNVSNVCLNSCTSGFPDESITFALVRGGTTQISASVRDGTGAYSDGKWHHAVVRIDGVDNAIFIDGVRKSLSYVHGGPGTSEFLDIDNPDAARIGGRRLSGADQLEVKGQIDEMAIWSRSLSDIEITELYRRGANRIKYQIKSCVDSSCNCKAYNPSPAGSSTDCDGDGTPNSSDNEDIYMAEFIGPGGDGSTQYSELFNRDPADLTFDCAANTSDSDNDICVDDEITLAGDTNATSPSFTFADMATSAAQANNRYFQYRVLMEAEDNTACSGEPCLPELTHVEVGPTGRYYGGSPVVSSNSPLSFGNIQSMNFSEGGSCSATYQLSPNGSTYYYFNGNNWVTAGSETVDLSSPSSQITSNISSFVGTAGTGDLYFKAFLNSDTSQACTIDNISLTKEVD